MIIYFAYGFDLRYLFDLLGFLLYIRISRKLFYCIFHILEGRYNVGR